MISRESAASVVVMLERALDDLRWAHSVVKVETDQDLASRIKPAWDATANTGGLLATIYEAYPELTGGDAAAGSVEQRLSTASGAAGRVARGPIQAALEDAVDQLDRVTEVIAAAEEADGAEKEHFRMRSAESVTALRAALQLLADAPSG
jgi:hypothetical protein